jgi:type I restriction enzyme S subunit
MSKNWPKVRLGEVLTHFQKYIDSPEARVYHKLSVKLYGRGVVLDAPADGAVLKMKRHQLARAGQVILSEIWGKKGAIGFVPPEGDGALCTSHFFLFDVRTDRVAPKWLQAIFDANYLQGQLDAEAKGTTGYAAVRPKILFACEIPLPPLAEQRRLVARIEALATQIRNAHVLRRQVEKNAEAIGRFTLGAFISKHVSAALLRDLCSQITDGEHATPLRIAERQVPLVTAKNVRDGYLDMSVTDSVSFETAMKCWKRCRPRDNDVLMVCVGATTGRVCRLIRPPEMVIVRSVAMLRPEEKLLDSRYLEYALESRELQDQIWNSVKQAAQPCLYLNRIGNLAIPLPALTEQRRIVAYLDDLQAKTNALKALQAESSAELDALMPSIHDKAFRGEL